MPYKHKVKDQEVSLRAYKFGAAVVGGEDTLCAEIRERNTLWNDLVRLHHELRDRREDALDTWRGLTPADMATHRADLAALRKQSHGDKDAKKALQEAEYADRQARRPGYQDPDVKEAHATIDGEASERSKLLAANAVGSATVATTPTGSSLYQPTLTGRRPLWWCNRDTVLLSWRSHWRDAHRLCFHRNTDGGTVTIRQSGGWSVDDLMAGTFAEKGYIRLSKVDTTSWYLPRAKRRNACRTPLRLWITADERGKNPSFADLLVFIHRPLPAGGTVQQVDVVRERVSNRWRWSVIFLVKLPKKDAPERLPGIVALDLGYRRLADGRLRVAVWRDDAGHSGEIALDLGWLSERAKTDNLRSIRDDSFNVARDVLMTFLRTNTVPIWLQQETKTLAQWQSPARLAILLRHWQDRRFSGDDEIVAILSNAWEAGSGRRFDWLARNLHLWQYEAFLRDQLIRRRRELYRCFATTLARQYGTILIEDVDWAKLIRRKKRGTAATDPDEQSARAVEDVANRMHFWAASAELESIITNAVKREGGEITKVPPRYITATCANCNTVNHWNHVELRHVCDSCGREWDQDENATRNLLLSIGPSPQTGEAAG